MINRKDRFIHKHGYGYLFSNSEMVRELIESLDSLQKKGEKWSAIAYIGYF